MPNKVKTHCSWSYCPSMHNRIFRFIILRKLRCCLIPWYLLWSWSSNLGSVSAVDSAIGYILPVCGLYNLSVCIIYLSSASTITQSFSYLIGLPEEAKRHVEGLWKYSGKFRLRTSALGGVAATRSSRETICEFNLSTRSP